MYTVVTVSSWDIRSELDKHSFLERFTSIQIHKVSFSSAVHVNSNKSCHIVEARSISGHQTSTT